MKRVKAEVRAFSKGLVHLYTALVSLSFLFFDGAAQAGTGGALQVQVRHDDRKNTGAGAGAGRPARTSSAKAHSLITLCYYVQNRETVVNVT